MVKVPKSGWISNPVPDQDPIPANLTVIVFGHEDDTGQSIMIGMPTSLSKRRLNAVGDEFCEIFDRNLFSAFARLNVKYNTPTRDLQLIESNIC